MNINQATIKLTTRPAKDGMVSVQMRVTFQRQQRRFSFPIKEGVIISPASYEKLDKYHQTKSARTAEDIKLLYARLEPHLQKAEDLCEKLQPFALDSFLEAFYKEQQEPSNVVDVIAALREMATRMNKEDRISTADGNLTTASSLERFLKSISASDRKALLGSEEVLTYRHITPAFLGAYEKWMLKYGKASRKPGGKPGPATLTTVGIYLRTLRTLYNQAIEKGLAKMEDYPFSKKGYTIPAGQNAKKALSKEEVLKIINYSCAEGMEQRGRDLWIFSYLSNGMNVADICRLRWKAIDQQAGTITFVREKTRRSRKGNQTQISVDLFPETESIIERWCTPTRSPNDFVFPFINDAMDARQQKTVIHQVIKMTNKYVNRIAEAVGIQADVNTYEARHSFATILLQSEAPVAFISQALGHTNLKTTESYLGSFGDEKKKKYLKSLL
ncbi:tyrosine-type recombinase/integrase [Tellurirhabdus bombi]|uniref:tyrosine-type recombinase/integrase n=1 Tax=Tellurirhabdus bombi TaxID=2907205 RepID=UPI001F37D0BD|nr:site-specific integrase [Tellurirhabdus bombi]